MSLVNNIQKLCLKKKIFIKNLEDELGFGNGSIYKWDVSTPSIDKVSKVAKYFAVSVDSLIEEKDIDHDQLRKSLSSELSIIEERIKEYGLRARSIKHQLKRLQKTLKGCQP